MTQGPVLIAAPARDPFVSELVRCLEAEGAQVVLTHRADSALRLARTRKPSVVVLDAVLPDGDAFSLCRRVKEDEVTKHTPVFFFSVLMSRDRCMEAGADGFLLKPVEQGLLLEWIHTVLNDRVRRLHCR